MRAIVTIQHHYRRVCNAIYIYRTMKPISDFEREIIIIWEKGSFLFLKNKKKSVRFTDTNVITLRGR